MLCNNIILNIKKNNLIKKIFKVISLKPASEIYAKDILKNIKTIDFNKIDKIICEEVIFYSAIRKLFPNRKIIVRFHNLYMLIESNVKKYKKYVSMKMLYNYYSFSRLEQKIIKDDNCEKYYITNNDFEFANEYNYSINNKILKMNYTNKINKNNLYIDNNIDVKSFNTLIIFGSVFVGHLRPGVEYFIKEIYLKYELFKDYKLFIFGKNTEYYNKYKKYNIYGMGFYMGENLPLDGKGIFLVPDILGLGIKTKIMDLINNNVYALVTNEAMKGYENIKSNKIKVACIEDWHKEIRNFRNNLYS